jgi:hypothetical protein
MIGGSRELARLYLRGVPARLIAAKLNKALSLCRGLNPSPDDVTLDSVKAASSKTRPDLFKTYLQHFQGHRVAPGDLPRPFKIYKIQTIFGGV